MSDSMLDLFGERVRFISPESHAVRVFFAHYHHRPHQRTWRPPTDVYEMEDAIIVKVELAGMDPGGIAVSLSGRVLNIHGDRKGPDEKRCYHCMEIPYGEFHANVMLPGPIDDAAITARYANGFLVVRLPKIAKSKAEVK